MGYIEENMKLCRTREPQSADPDGNTNTASMTAADFPAPFSPMPTGSTYHNNVSALEQWHIIPRMLRNAAHHNLNVGSRISLADNRELTTPRRLPFWH
jgi:hypothetical protein